MFLGFGRHVDDELIGSGSPSPEAEAVGKDELQKTQAAIAGLPLRLREALILVAIDGRSQREAAELLNVSEKAVETRIYRARRILKEKLLLS